VNFTAMQTVLWVPSCS